MRATPAPPEKREGMTKRGRTQYSAAKRGSIKTMPEVELKDATVCWTFLTAV